MISILRKIWDNKWLLRAMVSGRIPPPPFAIIDPANICNLRCPFCPTGTGTLKMPRRIMELNEFKIILDKLVSVRQLTLHNWGEPLLNPALPDMIRYAKQKGQTVSFDTNLAMPVKKEQMEALISSGLDEITVSLDGASQCTYEKYRRGGQFERVLGNLKLLMEVKNSLGQATPVVTWKFIVNRFNEPEIETARQMAREIGVLFNLSPMGIPAELQPTWAPQAAYRIIKKKGISHPRSICIWMFRFIVVSSDGSVLPCCVVQDSQYSCGNLLTQDFDDIWNGPQYRRSRSLMVPVLFRPRSTAPNPCVACCEYSTLAGAIRTRIADARIRRRPDDKGRGMTK